MKTIIPKELGDAGRALWKAVMAEYDVVDVGGKAHLLAACRAEDDICRMRATIAREGDVCKRDPSKPHPLLAAIRGLEAVRRQSLKALNLAIGDDLQPKPIGRPSDDERRRLKRQKEEAWKRESQNHD